LLNFTSHERSTSPRVPPAHFRISPAIFPTGGEPPTEPPHRRHTVARSTDTSRERRHENARAFFSVSIPRETRETGDRTRPQTHEMTRARDLAQLSGHSEADCEEVLAQCHGDVDRAIDRLLNSA